MIGQAHPLHLWDAVSGQLRATYRAYDAVDEVTAAYSVAFNRDGTRLLGGYNKAIRIFDTSRPGRFYTEIVTHSKKSHGLQGASQRRCQGRPLRRVLAVHQLF